jgi:hypothetical protein
MSQFAARATFPTVKGSGLLIAQCLCELVSLPA